jgi:hypothetical protein
MLDFKINDPTTGDACRCTNIHDVHVAQTAFDIKPPGTGVASAIKPPGLYFVQAASSACNG